MARIQTLHCLKFATSHEWDLLNIKLLANHERSMYGGKLSHYVILKKPSPLQGGVVVATKFGTRNLIKVNRKEYGAKHRLEIGVGDHLPARQT